MHGPWLRGALTLRRGMAGDHRSDIVSSLIALGDLSLGDGDYSSAERAFLDALELQTTTSGLANPDDIGLLIRLGRLYTTTGAYDRADAYFYARRKLSRTSRPM